MRTRRSAERLGEEQRMEEEKKEREAFAAAPLVVKDENGEDVTLYILEETKLNGCYYILAADSEEEDGECYLLKDVSGEDEDEAVYEFVENEDEAEHMLRVFQALLEEDGAEVDLRSE